MCKYCLAKREVRKAIREIMQRYDIQNSDYHHWECIAVDLIKKVKPTTVKFSNKKVTLDLN
jgi:hypothetical protein